MSNATVMHTMFFLFNSTTAPYFEYFLNHFKATGRSGGDRRACSRHVELDSVIAALAREPNGSHDRPSREDHIAGGSLPEAFSLVTRKIVTQRITTGRSKFLARARDLRADISSDVVRQVR
jgi:hypothetical protein